jgi:molybdopterin adenylyltransferase
MDAFTSIEGHVDSVGEMAKIGILVASDRASSNEYQDQGGPAILQFLTEAINSPLEVYYRCIPDTQELIE